MAAMARQSTKENARVVLRDAIISLCREMIPHKEEIAVEGLLGITVDQKDTWLVTIHEMIRGGQGKKRKLSEGTSTGLAVKTVVGNSNMYFNMDSESEGEKRVMPKRKYRSANHVTPTVKQASLSNGSQKAAKSSSPQKIDIMGETVEIKQEKPDSDSDEGDDTGNWELCVDQVQASNDDALANEVLEMSAESLRNFSSLRTKQVHGRLGSRIRLHEFSEECGDHRPHLIPPTARRSHPQKRCRVCYKQGLRKESRYCCPACPGYPGLCVIPCFELYHADKSYQSNFNIGFGFNFQELDPSFDITQALGLRQKPHHMVVKQDSMGRRTILSTSQTQALIKNEYVGPDDDIYLSAIDKRSVKSEVDDTEYGDTEMVSETEGQDEEEKQRVQEEKEINEEIKMLVSDVESTGMSSSGRLSLQEVIRAQADDDSQEGSSSDDKGEQEEQDIPETSSSTVNAIEIVPEAGREARDTIKMISSSSSEPIKTHKNVPESNCDAIKTIKIVSSSGKETTKTLRLIPTVNSETTKPIEIVPASSSKITKAMEIVSPSISKATTKTIESVPESSNKSTVTSPNIERTRSQTKKTIKIIPTSNTTLTDAVRALLTRPQVTEAETIPASTTEQGVPIVPSKAVSPIQIKSPTIVPKIVSAVPTSSGKSTFTISTPSHLGTQHPMPVMNAMTMSPTASAVNVISLPSGALLSGAKGSTTIRIPSAGSSTKTYMITKSASGVIKKTPIILKTVPMGTQVSTVPIAGATTVTTSTPPTLTLVKSAKTESTSVSPISENIDNYTIDLVPTPTSLNTQVLKVMVGKAPQGSTE